MSVGDRHHVPADAAAFDMRGAALSHHGGECSVETILRRYRLHDPVLWDLARIVREADLTDQRYDAPRDPGLEVLVWGLSMVRGDAEVVALTGPLFEGRRSTAAACGCWARSVITGAGRLSADGRGSWPPGAACGRLWVLCGAAGVLTAQGWSSGQLGVVPSVGRRAGLFPGLWR